jgi:hypothetical protein
MKKTLIPAVVIVSAIVLLALLRGTVVHKKLISHWPGRINELVAWVDRKSLSGGLKEHRSGFGSYVFIGSYDIDIDFDPGRYGLREGAAARVEVDESNQPMAVVFFDASYCGIAIATRAAASPKQAFIHLPSDIRITSSRVGTFCIKRD